MTDDANLTKLRMLCEEVASRNARVRSAEDGMWTYSAAMGSFVATRELALLRHVDERLAGLRP